MILYPSLVAEFPGVTLDRDIAIAALDDDVEPHGRPEDKAAHNARLEPLGIAGVDRAAIVDALDDEIARRDYDPDDDGIIAVADLPPAAGAPADALYVDNDDNVRDASEEEDEDNDDNNANNNGDNDDDEEDDEESLVEDDSDNEISSNNKESGEDGSDEDDDLPAAPAAVGGRRHGRAARTTGPT